MFLSKETSILTVHMVLSIEICCQEREHVMRSGRQQQLYAFCVDDTCTEQAFVFPICTEAAGIRDIVNAHIVTAAIYPSMPRRSSFSPTSYVEHRSFLSVPSS